MRHSKLWELLGDEFGDTYASSLARSHVLTRLGDRTAVQALDQGVSPREVWRAICEDLDVPEERRLGVDRRPRNP